MAARCQTTLLAHKNDTQTVTGKGARVGIVGVKGWGNSVKCCQYSALNRKDARDEGAPFIDPWPVEVLAVLAPVNAGCRRIGCTAIRERGQHSAAVDDHSSHRRVASVDPRPAVEILPVFAPVNTEWRRIGFTTICERSQHSAAVGDHSSHRRVARINPWPTADELPFLGKSNTGWRRIGWTTICERGEHSVSVGDHSSHRRVARINPLPGVKISVRAGRRSSERRLVQDKVHRNSRTRSALRPSRLP